MSDNEGFPEAINLFIIVIILIFWVVIGSCSYIVVKGAS